MEARDELIGLAVQHFQAARRLMDAYREDPSATGLMRCARGHVARVAALASEICSEGVGEALTPARAMA